MNKYVTLSTLRREMEFHNRRDCWRLALGGQVIDRPFNLSLIEETVSWDPDSEFRVCHADEPLSAVGRWRKVAIRKGTMPSKGHTTFFRVPTPPTPPKAEPEATEEAAPSGVNIATLERRLEAVEEHYATIVESIQRLQNDIAGMRGFAEMVDDMRAMKQEIEDVRDDINRNQFSLAGVRMEVAGVA